MKKVTKIISTIILLFIIAIVVYDIYSYSPEINYPNKLNGYDISHYNCVNNWDNIKADFIILKATEGSSIVDCKFQQYRELCKKHNIKVGAYHFFTTSSSPYLQFYNYYNTVGYDIDICPIIDIERMTNNHYLSKKELRKRIRTFVNLCKEKYNVKPIIYCSEHWYRKYFYNGFDDCFYWCGDVNYNTSLNYQIKQTEIKRASGFKGAVDHDIIVSNEIFIKQL